jgi:hypothetical protein
MSLAELSSLLNPPAQRPQQQKKTPTDCPPFADADRASVAESVVRHLAWLGERAARIREKQGTLTGETKAEVLARIEAFRRVVLAWPAWAAPNPRPQLSSPASGRVEERPQPGADLGRGGH